MMLHLRGFLVWSLATTLSIHWDAAGGEALTHIDSVKAKRARGQYGSDLSCLAKFYTPPQDPGESNHYIDMWTGQKTRNLALASGLTNNHALIINSHGKGLFHGLGNHHAYYPHHDLLKPNQNVPYFSAQDLARVLGPDNAGQIHNIVIAGCDRDKSFSPKELRKYFVNATNITHTMAGELGYQTMFLQTLLTDSANIEPLYESARKNSQGEVEYHLEKSPARNAVKLSPYVADLFRPGETKPFRTQVAGRELLEPTPEPLTASLLEQSSNPSNVNWATSGGVPTGWLNQ